MPLFIEAPTTFYMGRKYDPTNNRVVDEVVYYDSRDLTTHAVVVGMTGSGKTGLCITLLEEAAMDNIPAIIIDPKGDIANLMLTFPNLSQEEFLPWINPDDAQRAGLSPQEYAADTAQRWRDGLNSWGISPQRIAEFKQRTNLSIFTPGSDAGLPISIVNAMQPPREGWHGREEQHRERISGIVTALLALTDKRYDTKSREHVLISNIIEYAWVNNLPLELKDVIIQVQQPPFATLGVFDVNTFFPEKDRFKLAIELNNIIAAPSFSTWLQGEQLDIPNLLYTPQGAPRISIFYIAHLNDSQRSFIIALLLENMLAWMRTLGGTSTLRSILYFDEVFGHFPPYPKNPPTKDPLLRLLKQGRAFGLGMILATQNPGDLDYKGLSNAGTWFIGKLQTENDKKKVLDGLATASSAENPINLSEMDQLLSSIAPRVFVLNNIHDNGGPIVMHSRWAMSYLRGPMTRVQVSQLMAPYKQMPVMTSPYQAGYAPSAQYAAYGATQPPAQYTAQPQQPPYSAPQQPAYGTQQPPTYPAPPAAPQGVQGAAFQPQGASVPPSGVAGGFPPPPPSLPELGMIAPPPSLPEAPTFDPNNFNQSRSGALPASGFNPAAQQSGAAFSAPMPSQQYVQQPAMPIPQVSQPMPTNATGFTASQQQQSGLPAGYSFTPPSLSSTVPQYYLHNNIPLPQAISQYEQRTGFRANNVRDHVLLYQPFLLAQCDVRYIDRRTQINTVEKYAYHVPNVQRSGLIQWDEFRASAVDSRAVNTSPLDRAAYGELLPGLTDKKRMTALEREVIDYIYKTAGIDLPVNETLKVYSNPGMAFNEFQALVNSTARGLRDAEVDSVTEKYEREFDRLEERYRREERDLQADEASLQGLGRESLATMGEAALSLLQGRTTYTLSRVTRVRRYQEQAKQSLQESEEVMNEISRQMDVLQARFEQDIAAVNNKWAKIAANITQTRLTPAKKDIHAELFGIGWKPFYYVVLGDRAEILPAWQGQYQAYVPQQPQQPNYQQPYGGYEGGQTGYQQGYTGNYAPQGQTGGYPPQQQQGYNAGYPAPYQGYDQSGYPPQQGYGQQQQGYDPNQGYGSYPPPNRGY